jgi:hypothetical protein
MKIFRTGLIIKGLQLAIAFFIGDCKSGGIMCINDDKQTDKDSITFKRCPECFVNLKLDAVECISCGEKVGRIDKFGKARKNINWGAYLFTFVSWSVFLCYIWWAFFRRIY